MTAGDDDKPTFRELRASPVHELAPGTVLAGRYCILAPLGAGGMGAVYEAEQIELRRRVAIKLVLDREGESFERLRREALGASAVQSPHVVTVLDFHWDEGEPPFLVMELLSGVSLADVMADEGALAPPRACRLACQVLDGLGAAHRASLVHRDVKPSNVWIVPTMAGELVKLLDFGLVKNVEDTVGITARSGRLMGTRAYLAPEQIHRLPPDPRSDLHAVGVVLWEMLTGKRLWKATGPDVFAEIVTRVPERVSQLAPHVPEALSDVVARALAKDPEGRFRDAGEMLAALEPFTRATSAPELDRIEEAPETVGRASPPSRVRTAVMAPFAPPVPVPAPRASAPGPAPAWDRASAAPWSAPTSSPALPPARTAGPGAGFVVAIVVLLLVALGGASVFVWARTHPRRPAATRAP